MSSADDGDYKSDGVASADRNGRRIGPRVLISVGIVTVGILVFILLSQIPRAPRQTGDAEGVRTLEGIPVRLGPVPLSMAGFGKAEPVQMVEISSEVKARIRSKRLELKAGVLVNKGETLLELDAGDYEANLKIARAELSRLRSELAIKKQFVTDTTRELQAQIRIGELETAYFKRIKSLVDKRASYQTELEKAEMAMQVQERQVIDTRRSLAGAELELHSIAAQIDKAGAEVDLAELNISRCVIRSPIAGRLRSVAVDQGEYVNVGTKLLEIADDSRLEIPVALEAGDVVKILPLRRIAVAGRGHWFEGAAGIPVEIEWVEHPARSRWNGRVVRLDRFDADTGTFYFVVSPTEPLIPAAQCLPLVDGMFCRVTFKGRTIPDAMLAPWSAVQLEGSVFVADRDGRLQQRKVGIYCSTGAALVIDSGLSNGESLILQKLPRGAVNGMKVKIVPPESGKYRPGELTVVSEAEKNAGATSTPQR